MPQRIHIVGIGGIGLSAIARVLLARGVAVSGSDLVASPITGELGKLGAKIFIGHRADNVGNADLLLVTSAARQDNPEIIAARARLIRVDKRYDFFPKLTAGKKTIAIAGTHGKTTTSAMIALMLTNAGLDPTAIIGGMIPEWQANARAGNGEYFVIEADEYERAFLGLTPQIGIVTNIEMDHPDIYRDEDDVAGAFREFIQRILRQGTLIVCGDSVRAAREAKYSNARVIRYGFAETNDLRAQDIRANAQGGNNFTAWRAGAPVGEFQLRVPGKHNVLNALASIAVAEHLGIPRGIAQATLRAYRGAARRFELKADSGGIAIVDDYAHLPTEIRVTLAAARERFPGRAVWAVFQPHTFSRTRALLHDFANAFEDADHVIVADIYAAREKDDGSVHSRLIVAEMHHPDARYIAKLDEIAPRLNTEIARAAVVLTMGAGDVNRVGDQLQALLNARLGG
ncbi:MAG: UDP-N-acetylmuramate--L-alanine ligase [Chloroflexi bacterium]|nr:UDP-N-acetylmuramate--L-alanine ligase [Chloroflexota bacterium]